MKLEGSKCQRDNGQYTQPFWQVMQLNYYAPPLHSLQRLQTLAVAHKQYSDSHCTPVDQMHQQSK